MNNCIVTIPIYKASPMSSEAASFRQGLTILRNYDICVITHRDCDLSIYKQMSTEAGKEFSVQMFDNDYFSSVQGYNKLCCSFEFYERFQQYKFMFIYQLDAWVFRDELQNWCDKGYDYIGAPVFWAYNINSFTTKVAGIGNGGLSLRKISYCLKTLSMSRKRPYLKPSRIFSMYYNYFLYADKYRPLKIKLLILPLCLVKSLGMFNSLNYFMKTKKINEDMIFGVHAKHVWGSKVNFPSEIEAMRFSFEVHPEILFHIIDDQLPFGCHAFEKWGFDTFWSKHINI
jgi:hypothetical protein